MMENFMEICWDNIEKLKYRPDREDWLTQKGSTRYVYIDNCKICQEPFLSYKNSKICSQTCKSIFLKTIIGNKTSGYGKPGYWKDKKRPDFSGKMHPNWKGGYHKRNIPLYDTYAHQIEYAERVRRNKADSNILEVKCTYCGKWYIPKRRHVYDRIVGLNNHCSEYRLYCSDNCKQECPIFYKKDWPKGFKKSTSREVQPQLRQLVLERDNYTCQKCEKHQDELEVGLHCHHFEGIEINPIESADVDNCITLCKTCHKEVHKLPGCGYHDMRCK